MPRISDMFTDDESFVAPGECGKTSEINNPNSSRPPVRLHHGRRVAGRVARRRGEAEQSAEEHHGAARARESRTSVGFPTSGRKIRLRALGWTEKTIAQHG